MEEKQAKKMVRVVALERGYDGQIREKDEVFFIAEGTKGSWFKPFEGEQPKPAARPRAGQPVPASRAPAREEDDELA